MWIEILKYVSLSRFVKVTPRAGVWIEILMYHVPNEGKRVTPRAGVWIEIRSGLFMEAVRISHSPCGSVD